MFIEEGIFARYSLKPWDQQLTLEDLRQPQLESGGVRAGRIDYDNYEFRELQQQWSKIVAPTVALLHSTKAMDSTSALNSPSQRPTPHTLAG